VSTLTLVRHGQAQRFQSAPAALSSTGEAQARKLAEWWHRNNVRFDEVWCGSLPRQCHTAQIVADALHWPQPTVDAAWNEYDATGVLRSVPNIPEDPRAFQRIFEAAMHHWLEQPESADFEPWPAFRDRVGAALARIRSGPSGRRIAVFTSGGPVGFAVHQACQSPCRTFLDVNWRVRNCSITEFIFDRTRFTLDAFNAIPHLDDTTLLTYR